MLGESVNKPLQAYRTPNSNTYNNNGDDDDDDDDDKPRTLEILSP